MSDDVITGIDPRPVPLIAAVEAGPGTMLTVRWQSGGGVCVDLAGWISLHDVAALRVPGIFLRPEIGEDGDTVQWAGDENLSIDSVHLELLAEQQAAFDAAALAAWQSRHSLSNREAADLFGVHVNTWTNYRSATNPVPRAVTIAARAIDRDPLLLTAFLRPRRPGRPPAAAE
ncbi:hypothetical protein [Azospirillum halopraeferens]|uniref:hypothetical protein n=1 Tax=Azospirillum halopraeferens TaxID=34010 RepID=UPI0003F5DDE0|nr:hypothetical protein [Azospirillum halopraeferens]